MDEKAKEGRQECLLWENAPVFQKYEPVDRLFAVIYLLAGYGFVRLCSSSGFERNLAVYTLFYAAVVLCYLWSKEMRPPKESWFWLAVMLAVGIPYAFWTVLYFLQFLALLVAAAYWTLSASGRLLKDGRTSQWVFFDSCNALFFVPFGNFGCQMRVLSSRTGGEDGQRGSGRIRAILLGVLITVPVLVIILPLLSSADAAFQSLIGDLGTYTSEHLWVIFVRMVFAVPVSCYLFGLAFGGLHGKCTDRFQEENLRRAEEKVRIVPDTAVCTALTVICLVYCLFVGLQGTYLFSAFTGRIPENFTYSEYARRGFFELCQIGAWNLVFTGAACACSRTGRRKHKGLCALTLLLAVLTLLLLATAVSKLGMYICVYGLTVYRILPLVFLLWMGLVFVCVILHQNREFRMVRFCVMAGAVLFCIICICPVEHWTELYNVWARGQGLIV